MKKCSLDAQSLVYQVCCGQRAVDCSTIPIFINATVVVRMKMCEPVILGQSWRRVGEAVNHKIRSTDAFEIWTFSLFGA